MGKPLIVIGSITYAMKAKSILSSHGFNANIVRTPKGSKVGGCGYSIYVKDKIDEAIEILNEHGIRVTGKLDGDD